nr:hypothetical protein [Tanacetum cinerariifolium]
MLPVAPPSPDYIPGPEEPQTPQAPQDKDEHELMFILPHEHDFVPEPIYPEYIPLEDEHILLAEEHLLPPVVSPTAESPGYVAESDPEDDPEEYEIGESSMRGRGVHYGFTDTVEAGMRHRGVPTSGTPGTSIVVKYTDPDTAAVA